MHTTEITPVQQLKNILSNYCCKYMSDPQTLAKIQELCLYFASAIQERLDQIGKDYNSDY